MPLARVGKLAIHYEIEGSTGAPALLLLNSLGTSLAMWDDQMAEFLKHCRVIRYDVRGHGRSSPTDTAESTVSTLAADALAVLNAANLPIAHWCGLSLGGMTAMWAAAHYPERVARLALCNTSAHLPPASLWQSRMDLVRREGMPAAAAAIIQRWFTPAFCTAAPEKVARIRRMLLATHPESYAAACAAIRDMDQRPHLSRIAAPTLILGGSMDPATPAAHSEALRAGIAGAQLVMLDAAHLSNVERSGEFSAAVSEFLCSGEQRYR